MNVFSQGEPGQFIEFSVKTTISPEAAVDRMLSAGWRRARGGLLTKGSKAWTRFFGVNMTNPKKWPLLATAAAAEEATATTVVVRDNFGKVHKALVSSSEPGSRADAEEWSDTRRFVSGTESIRRALPTLRADLEEILQR